MPIRRKYRRRRVKKRPRARRRVDKVQDRRIARLENSKEVKVFDIQSQQSAGSGPPVPTPFEMTSYLTNSTGLMVEQIKNFTCEPAQSLADTGRIGDQIEVKSLKMRFQASYHPVQAASTATATANCRVLVFWDHTPVGTSGVAPFDAATVVRQLVDWPSLLQQTHMDVSQSNNSYGALLSYKQTDINKRKPPRFTFLMDKIFALTPSRISTITWNIHKSYKALRHKFLAAGDVCLNRGLYVAFLSDIKSTDTVQPKLQVQARYTYTDS